MYTEMVILVIERRTENLGTNDELVRVQYVVENVQMTIVRHSEKHQPRNCYTKTFLVICQL